MRLFPQIDISKLTTLTPENKAKAKAELVPKLVNDFRKDFKRGKIPLDMTEDEALDYLYKKGRFLIPMLNKMGVNREDLKEVMHNVVVQLKAEQEGVTANG